MCLAWVLKKMKIEKRIENEIVHENELQKTSFFELYTPQNSHTHSTSISSTYNQVFADKTGFLPNLSILDLLFNEGPHAKQVLLNINAKLPSNSSV
jgi:hypothetical protein